MYQVWQTQVVLRRLRSNQFTLYARSKDGGRWLAQHASQVPPQDVEDAVSLFAALTEFVEVEGYHRDSFSPTQMVKDVRSISPALAKDLAMLFNQGFHQHERVLAADVSYLSDVLDELFTPVDVTRGGVFAEARDARRARTARRNAAFAAELRRMREVVARSADEMGARGSPFAQGCVVLPSSKPIAGGDAESPSGTGEGISRDGVQSRPEGMAD